jgi:Ser/Thr protein kinase RdoA (MazF antagonist)
VGRPGAAPPPPLPAELTPTWAVRYLLERGILSRADVVRGAIAVDDASMSHRAFSVSVRGRPRFFVKCADSVGSQGRDLAVETVVYRLAIVDDSLRRVVPACHHLDEEHGIVVLEAVAGPTLATVLEAAPAPDEATAGRLRRFGEAIGLLHCVEPRPLGSSPWLLYALEPVWGAYDWLPPPCAAVLRRLAAQPRFRDGFRAAAASWLPNAFIHGDLRCANVLEDVGGRLLLVDWELACHGDAAWDLGCALADVVSLLALGLPEADFRYVEAWAEPLLHGHAAASASEPLLPLVERAVRLAGLRLVQSLLEIGHVDVVGMAHAEPALVWWAGEFLEDAHRIADALVTRVTV